MGPPNAARDDLPLKPAPEVSVVLPCYKSAHLALETVAELRGFLSDARLGDWEIIVVDDGGGDFRPDPWPGETQIRLVRLSKNSGKGAAIVAGMCHARGHARIFTDIDLPYGPAIIPVMAEYIHRGFHLVIGDRTMPSARYHNTITWQRRFVSRLSSRLIGSIVTGGFFDTQCGVKAIRGDVADIVFPLVRLKRFAFDVELIYIALVHRLDIKRVPVELRANQTSSVRVFRDSAQGIVDILRIKHNQMRGCYESDQLRSIVLDEFDRVRSAHAVSQHSVGID